MRRALGVAVHTLRFPLPESACIFRESSLTFPGSSPATLSLGGAEAPQGSEQHEGRPRKG